MVGRRAGDRRPAGRNRDFGARGDGATLDTAALPAAIDACNKDRGGTVLVPAGVAADATLLGRADGKQYHAIDAIPLSGDSTLQDGNWGLIFATDGQGAVPQSGARGPSAVGARRRAPPSDPPVARLTRP
jgi:hypothetical protein